MAKGLSAEFIGLINANLGIAHKVCRFYFQESADKEDAIQEMMFQLWRSYPGFDHRSQFSTWMYKVCLNTALTYKRKLNRQRTEKLSSDYDSAIPVSHNKEEDIRLLWNGIRSLSPLNKAIVLLYLEELSYEEIANITGLSKSNVSVRLVRIKKDLETFLLLKS